MKTYCSLSHEKSINNVKFLTVGVRKSRKRIQLRIYNSLLRYQTKSLVSSELVHSVDVRWAQGCNGQPNPTVESSEARVETGTHQETEQEAGQEHREYLRI